MSFAPPDEALVCVPSICDLAQIELAHDLMQRHRNCRADNCAWKQLAYRTLVHCRRIEPPLVEPTRASAPTWCRVSRRPSRLRPTAIGFSHSGHLPMCARRPERNRERLASEP